MASDDWDEWRDALDDDFEAEAQAVAPPPGAGDRVLAAVLGATAGAGAGGGATGVSAWVKGALLGALVGGAVVAVWVAGGSPEPAASSWDAGGAEMGVDAGGAAVTGFADGGGADGMRDGIDGGLDDAELEGMADGMLDGMIDGMPDGIGDGTPDGMPDGTPSANPPRGASSDGAARRASGAAQRPKRQRAERQHAERQRATSPADTLRAESALLVAARGRLAAGDAAGALARAETHRRRFPRGRLWQEREVIAIKALWALERRAAAQARAARFVERVPDSAYRRTLAPMLPEAP